MTKDWPRQDPRLRARQARARSSGRTRPRSRPSGPCWDRRVQWRPSSCAAKRRHDARSDIFSLGADALRDVRGPACVQAADTAVETMSAIPEGGSAGARADEGLVTSGRTRHPPVPRERTGSSVFNRRVTSTLRLDALSTATSAAHEVLPSSRDGPARATAGGDRASWSLGRGRWRLPPLLPAVRRLAPPAPPPAALPRQAAHVSIRHRARRAVRARRQERALRRRVARPADSSSTRCASRARSRALVSSAAGRPARRSRRLESWRSRSKPPASARSSSPAHSRGHRWPEAERANCSRTSSRPTGIQTARSSPLCEPSTTRLEHAARVSRIGTALFSAPFGISDAALRARRVAYRFRRCTMHGRRRGRRGAPRLGTRERRTLSKGWISIQGLGGPAAESFGSPPRGPEASRGSTRSTPGESSALVLRSPQRMSLHSTSALPAAYWFLAETMRSETIFGSFVKRPRASSRGSTGRRRVAVRRRTAHDRERRKAPGRTTASTVRPTDGITGDSRRRRQRAEIAMWVAASFGDDRQDIQVPHGRRVRRVRWPSNRWSERPRQARFPDGKRLVL